MWALLAGTRLSRRSDRPGMSADDPGRLPEGMPAINAQGIGVSERPDSPAGAGHVDETGDTPPFSEPRRDTAALTGALGAIVAVFFIVTPWPLPDKLHAIGHACCAQIPSHTIRFAGQAMPIDARNTGIYTAVFVTVAMVWMAGRRKAALFVTPRLGLLLMALVLAMVFDGFNSLAESHHLHTYYIDTNNLRLVTGTFAGIALTILTLPLFNLLVWRRPEPVAIAEDVGELAGYLVAGLVVIVTLARAPASLYYPMSILSIAGLLVTLSFVNTCTGLVAFHRRNQIDTPRDFLLPGLAGLVVACFEIAAIDFWLAGH